MGRTDVTILCTAPLPPGVVEDLAARFTVLGPEVIGSADFAAIAPRVRGLACRPPTPVTAALLEALPNLEILSSYSAGLEYVDLDAARRRGLVIANTSAALTDDVADTAMALLLAAVRRFSAAERFVRAGDWAAGAFPLSRSLTGRRLGIVGLGHIGAALATRATAFGMSVAYHGPRAKAAAPYPYHPTAEGLAAESDFLALCCPGGPDTRHLVNAAVLRALGPGGVVVNVARGSVVDEDALLAALADGTIAGAGLDVCEDEPTPRAELLTHPDIVLFPHVGSATEETRARMAAMMRDALVAHFSDRL
ncbi:2-hydroxyacid dehydrogenase [Azospirillum griseum]|uniref:2-hydroxyacid dehydrogenase n=1 Tax=Azospirillum griseum TaxID=2496639 RepID=A0A3S0JFD3_9PROT|nr:2-hydroxyacid dehydrogenase [Azospirillum griseum]RTR16435.1 2-hydroxyacid dehydrogenase [Azospirillum griseum]